MALEVLAGSRGDRRVESEALLEGGRGNSRVPHPGVARVNETSAAGN